MKARDRFNASPDQYPLERFRDEYFDLRDRWDLMERELSRTLDPIQVRDSVWLLARDEILRLRKIVSFYESINSRVITGRSWKIRLARWLLGRRNA